ncbi:MAG: hypothetical protein M8861_00565 [marine benthic group bacterium]|nr:hypothetical protein [Gemmatimonadota bacterium]
MRSVAARVLAAAVMSWVFFLSPSDLEAQEARTLVRGESSNGGFGAVGFKGSGVNDQFAGFFGARGAWMIDHVFALGAGGYVMGGGVDVEGSTGPQSLKMWYGGAEIEFISGWSEVYHFTFLTLIGGGSLDLEGQSDGIWAAEPALNLEINVNSFLRLDFGGGYRFVWDVDIPDLSNGDLSQFFGQIVLKFGAF